MTTPVLDKQTATQSDLASKFGPLTALDRCEASATKMLEDGKTLGKGECGAQAFVRAVLPSGFDLVFCKHHGDKQAPALIAQGASLLDESGRINTAASASSA